jgi:hypothetical protein
MLRLLGKRLQKLVNVINMYGIPLPMVRDPKTGMGSVSLTLVFISSIMVILGLVGKWSGRLGTIDINNSLEFFYASSALYFGRNWKKGGASEDLSEENSDEPSKVEKVDKPDESSPK